MHAPLALPLPPATGDQPQGIEKHPGRDGKPTAHFAVWLQPGLIPGLALAFREKPHPMDPEPHSLEMGSAWTLDGGVVLGEDESCSHLMIVLGLQKFFVRPQLEEKSFLAADVMRVLRTVLLMLLALPLRYKLPFRVAIA